MKSFEEAADRYDSFAFIQRKMAEWLADWLPPERKGTALEIAAGTGLFTRHLLPWSGELLATDASPGMVAQGTARFPRAQWSVAEARELPDVSVDWIFSSSFLQWADHPVTLLDHWKSRLGPKGRILAGFFVAPTLAELDRVLPGAAPLQWRSPEDWGEFISQAGLRLIRSEASERVFLFPSALELLRTLHGIGAAPARRSSAPVLRQALRDYDARFAEKNGVRSTWTFYKFEAGAT